MVADGVMDAAHGDIRTVDGAECECWLSRGGGVTLLRVTKAEVIVYRFSTCRPTLI